MKTILLSLIITVTVSDHRTPVALAFGTENPIGTNPGTERRHLKESHADDFNPGTCAAQPA